MKKLTALILVLAMAVCCFAGCTGGKPETTTAADNTTATPAGDSTTEGAAQVDINAKDEGVLTYAAFVALETGKEAVIEGFLQAKYDYSEGYKNPRLYLVDGDGAYYVYRYGCEADDYAKLEIGAKLKVTGSRAEYHGEIEVSDVTALEVVGTDKYVADVLDITSSLASEDLIKNQNRFVCVKGAEIVASTVEGKDYASLYKYNGSGTQGDDVYFKIKVGEGTYTYLVESDFCNKDTDVYKAAEALKIGDKIDIEGYLYWYDGAQIQVTSIKAAS